MPRTLTLRWILAALCAGCLASGRPAGAQQYTEPETSNAEPQGANRATQIASLDGVVWEGPTVSSLDQFRGKTVVVLTYVTWCPKCAKWAVKMLREVKEAISDKPVIVLAVSTDAHPAKAKQYLAHKGFVGPNILHGYDPQLAKSFGFANEFYNFAIIDPQGRLSSSGNAGSTFVADDGEKTTLIVHRLERMPNLGQFQFPELSKSHTLHDLLWPIELGDLDQTQRVLKRIATSLNAADRKTLKATMDRFVQQQIGLARELSTGEPSARLAALEKANFVANNFKDSPEAKEAVQLAASLTQDKELKRELIAKKLYDQSMQTADPNQRIVILENAGERFPGTYYGALAEKAAAANRR